MLNLICNIEIKNKDSKKTVSFDYVSSIDVKTSIKNLTDTATIKVPKKMRWRTKPLTDFIGRDDEITIQMGYEEHGLETVFTGYLTGIENGMPLVITAENDMRLFKTITVKAENIAKFDIKEYFQKYGVKVETTGDIQLGSMNIKEEMPLSRAFDEIMKTYPFLKGFFRDGIFYVTMLTTPFAERKAIVFDPQRNMISDSLKYTLAEDVKIGIKAVSILRDNTKLEAYAPSEAFDKKTDKEGKVTISVKSDWNQRQFYCPQCKTQKEVQDFANETAKQEKSDKMTGTFKAFGIPYVRKGDKVMLKYAERPEYNGKTFVAEAVDYNFGTGGYRQTITLGDQLR